MSKDRLVKAALAFVKARRGPMVQGRPAMNFPTPPGLSAWDELVAAADAYEARQAEKMERAYETGVLARPTAP